MNGRPQAVERVKRVKNGRVVFDKFEGEDDDNSPAVGMTSSSRRQESLKVIILLKLSCSKWGDR